jgi:hypothetical protein
MHIFREHNVEVPRRQHKTLYCTLIHKYEIAVIHTSNPEKNRTGARHTKKPNPRVDFQPKIYGRYVLVRVCRFTWPYSLAYIAPREVSDYSYGLVQNILFIPAPKRGYTVPYYVEHNFLLTKGGGGKYNNSFIMRYSCHKGS